MGTGIDQAWADEKARKKSASKEARAAYQASERGKEVTAAYQASERGRETTAAYEASAGGKETRAAYEASERGKEVRAAWLAARAVARMDPKLVEALAKAETPECKAELVVKYVASKQPIFDPTTGLTGKKEDLRQEVITLLKQYHLAIQSDLTLEVMWCDSEYFPRPPGDAQQIQGMNNTIYELGLRK
jgi:hypothetical protein